MLTEVGIRQRTDADGPVIRLTEVGRSSGREQMLTEVGRSSGREQMLTEVGRSSGEQRAGHQTENRC